MSTAHVSCTLEDQGLLDTVENIRAELERICELPLDEAAEAQIVDVVCNIGDRIHPLDVRRERSGEGEYRFTLSPSEELVALLEALRAWNGEGPLFPEAA